MGRRSRRDERRDIEVTSTSDIETEAWDIFVIGGMYILETQEYRVTRDLREFARWLLEVPGTHWAHNGGRFDWLPVLDCFVEWGVKCDAAFAGGRIVCLRYPTGMLCDSAALWPEKLKEITSGQMHAKDEVPFPCVCGEECGGFCSIRRDMSEEDYAKLIAYNKRDCISLADALTGLRDAAAANDLDLGMTIGSSAFRNARRMLQFEREATSLTEHKFRRLAFYGGRTQALRLGECGPGCDYDIIGMYTFLLAHLEFSVGAPDYLYGRSAMAAFQAGKSGIYQVNVTVPESFLPPLPVRTKERLAYPYGTFEGVYSYAELNNAVERYGVTINSFREARAFNEKRKIFAPWVARVMELRTAAGKKTPLGLYYKRYGNSAWGKLCSRPEKDHLRIWPDSISEGDEPVADGIYTRRTERVDECSHIIWGLEVSSAGRIMLLDKAHQGAGPEHVNYLDTDGLLIREQRPAGVRDEHGAWEEKKYKRLVVIAPKVYAIEYGDGTISSRAKGIRVPRDQVPEVGRVYKVTGGVKGAKTRKGRTKFFERNDITRTLARRSGDRIAVGNNGETRPPHISEVKLA